MFDLGAMLDNQRPRRKRSKGLIIILLPAFIIIGAIGWLLISLDHQKTAPQNKTRRKVISSDKENISFVPIIFEDQTIARMHNTTKQV